MSTSVNTQNLLIFACGLTSALLQITVLRQFMTVFSGNELDIGITVSVWLTAVGAGSLIGHRMKNSRAFLWSFLIIALMVQSTVTGIHLIRLLTPFEFGEAIPLNVTIISTVALLSPVCLVIGAQFPLAISYSGKKPAEVYATEALGAFAGGLIFTLLLSGRMDAYALAAALALLNLMIVISLAGKRSLLLLLMVPVLFYLFTEKSNGLLQWRGATYTDKTESKYGELLALKTGVQVNIYSAGKLAYSYPDPQTEELRVHLPLSVHPSPLSVLVLGGSPALLREVLKYPFAHADFVETDPRLIDFSIGLLSAEDRTAIKDKRVKIVSEDAGRFLKSLPSGRYDFVLMDLPEPSTANMNRFYTTGFFQHVLRTMNNGGIFSLRLPTASGYMSRKLQMVNGSVWNSLKKVFPYTEVSSEEYGLFFASAGAMDVSPRSLSRRYSDRMMKTEFFAPYLFDDAFAPIKVQMVRERLDSVTAVNTELRPVAYLYHLILWTDIHGGGIISGLIFSQKWQHALLPAVMVPVIFFLFWRKKQSVYYSMFTTGYATMAFSLSVLLSYQAIYGSIYEMIGLLTATFMLGTAAGAHLSKGPADPIRRLKILESAFVCLLLCTPLFLRWEPFFYCANFLCGLAGGMMFAAANQSLTGSGMIATAGRLYAVDLTGSFLGALITSLLVLPLYGVRNTLLLLAMLKGTSLALLGPLRHEKI